MILTIDIGNSNIVLGGVEGDDIRFEARLRTDATKTSDEYCIDLKMILEVYRISQDMIDGTIARKTGTVSEFGTRLDSVADFVFLSVSLAKFLPAVQISQWLWVWIVVIGVVKIGNLIWGYVRIKTLVSLHTVMSKITGLLLFLLPLTFPVIDLNYSSIAVCVIASLAAFQESFYIATGYKNNEKILN